MSGIERLSDAALSGAGAGAAAGQAPILNSSTGHFAPGSPKYDPRLQVYNLSDTCFSKWRLAVAGARNGVAPAHLVCLGDSITGSANQITGDTWLNGYPGRLRAYLEARAGAVAGFTGLVSAASGTFNSQAGGNRPQTTPALAVSDSGTWGSASTYGFFNVYFSSTATSTKTFTWTGSQSIRIYFARVGGAGTHTSTLDGAGAASVTNASSGGIFAQTYTPVGSGNHSLVFTVGASGQLAICGVELLATTGNGFSVHNLGMGSTTSAYPLGAGGAGNNPSQQIDIVAPALTVILYGTNDMNAAAVPVTTYTTNIQSSITKARTTGDVLLVTPPRANNAGASPNSYADYCNALYALSDANDVPVLDLRNRYASNPNSYLDAIGHPTNTAAYDMAQAVYAAITQQVGV